jgi:beta-mannosidase
MKKASLSQGWYLKPAPSAKLPEGFSFPEKGLAVAIPGTVHSNLFKAKLISDPFYGENEARLQWIHEIDWIYFTIFDIPDSMNIDGQLFLQFEGIDTISEIYLNENLVGTTENMFRSYEFDIKPFVRKVQNHLFIKIISPTKYGFEQEKKYGKLPVSFNSTRVYLRKAQYSYGWDWGPSFPTLGIWKPVFLIQPDRARIKSVRFHTKSLKKNKAFIVIQVDIESKLSWLFLTIDLHDKNKSLQTDINLRQKKSTEITLTVPDPKLWWPNGEGNPNLYHLKVTLHDKFGRRLDEWNSQVGIRTIKLGLQKKGKPSFQFIVNDKPVFIKGANWIPADSFLDRITENKYRKLPRYAKDAQLNMLRVWGGGIYENSKFYNICDELGLLVWQDFMFACGIYPNNRRFIKNIDEEFKQNINKLQHHPCIALWCGNNENEWLWFADFNKPVKKMPDYKIYHEIIPRILRKLDPYMSYWPSSPFGKDDDPNSYKSGNRHEWGIWSEWKDYTEILKDKSLFVTEFGFQAPANIKTLQKALPRNSWRIQDKQFEFHNKQIEGNERLFKFLATHLPISIDWEDYIYLTQLNQAFAMKTFIEYWRFRSPECFGSIIWQLNDCWPVTSWSLIDSALLPKISYDFVKLAFNPIIAIVKQVGSDIKIFIKNELKDKFSGNLQIVCIQTTSGKIIDNQTVKIDSKTRKMKEVFSVPRSKWFKGKDQIVVISLYDEGSEKIYRNFYIEGEWKHKKLAQLEVFIRGLDEKTPNHVVISTNKPAYFMDLYHPSLQFEKRGFILLPGENEKIKVTRLSNKPVNSRDIKVFALNKYLQN